jgi:hypothetical protein
MEKMPWEDFSEDQEFAPPTEPSEAQSDSPPEDPSTGSLLLEGAKMLGGKAVDTTVAIGRGVNPFADEIGAGIMALIDKDMSYAEAKAFYDKDYKMRQERTPVGIAAGELGGAVILPTPGLASVKLVQNANKVAKFLGTAKVAVQNAFTHGAFGAMYGAAEGDTVDERLQNALWGGAFGATGANIARPIMNLAEKAALKSIAVKEMAIQKMAAYIPGGTKKLGKYLIEEAIISPITGLKGVIKKIDKIMPKVRGQYEEYLNLASEAYGANFNMKRVIDKVHEEIVVPLMGGDTKVERHLANKIQNFFPGWYEKPVRTLKEANNSRVLLDDVLADTYMKLKEAKIMGSQGGITERTFARIRGLYNDILDNQIDDVLAGITNAKSYGAWKETKTTMQMLIEAKQGAIQRIKRTPGLNPRDVILATAMPFSRYSAVVAGTGLGSSLLYGRAGAIGAKGLQGASRLAESAGPLMSVARQQMGGEEAPADDFIPLDEAVEETPPWEEESGPWNNYSEE